MKTKFLSLILSIVIMLGMIPLSVTATGTEDTYAVELQISENVLPYNGQNTLEVGMSIQSDNLSVMGSQSFAFVVDLNVLDFIGFNYKNDTKRQNPLNLDAALESVGNDKLTATMSKNIGIVTRKTLDTETGWTVNSYYAISGSNGYVILQPSFSEYALEIKDVVKPTTILLGFKENKSKDDLTKDSIRLMNLQEATTYSQDSVVLVGNTETKKSQYYMWAKGGVQENFTELTITPTVNWGTIEVQLPKLATPTGLTWDDLVYEGNWTAVTGAKSYTAKLLKFNKTTNEYDVIAEDKQVTKANENDTTIKYKFQPIEEDDYNAANTYMFTVVANGDNVNYASSDTATSAERKVVATPTNLTWDTTTNTLEWDAVEGAKQYQVYVFKSGETPSKFNNPVTTNSYTLTENDKAALDAAGPGAFYFEVCVNACDDGYYNRGLVGRSPSITRTKQLAAITSLEWVVVDPTEANKQYTVSAKWNAVENPAAASYTLEIFKDGAAVTGGTIANATSPYDVTGILKNNGEGNYTFKVTANPASDSYYTASEATVETSHAYVINVESITLNQYTAKLYNNGTSEDGKVTLTATISPDGTNETVTWNSSDTSVATVNEAGVVTAVVNANAGATANITASAGNVTSEPCVVTIASYLKSVTITATNASLDLNGEATLTATIGPEGADFDKEAARVVWRSSDANVTVKQDASDKLKATVKGVASGSAIITVEVNGITSNELTIAVDCKHESRTLVAENKNDLCSDIQWDSHYECTGCFQLFTDKEGTTIYVKPNTYGTRHQMSAYKSDDKQHYKICERTGCFYKAQNGRYYTDAEDHQPGTLATCQDSAICEICELIYGSKDSTNHVEEAAFDYTPNNSNKGTHKVTYKCCGAVKDAAEECSGGTATCIAEAECQYCEVAYGGKNFENHTKPNEQTYKTTDTTHQHVYACCEKPYYGAEVEPHEYGEDDSLEECTVCGFNRSCEHPAATLTTNAEIPASCLEDGTTGRKEYYTCGVEKCRRSFFYNDEVVLTYLTSENMSALDVMPSHTFNLIDAKDANCCNDGNKAHNLCTICGRTYATNADAAAVPGNVVDAVIKANGNHEMAENDSWHNDDKTHFYICKNSKDGSVRFNEAAHTKGPDGLCITCEYIMEEIGIVTPDGDKYRTKPEDLTSSAIPKENTDTVKETVVETLKDQFNIIVTETEDVIKLVQTALEAIIDKMMGETPVQDDVKDEKIQIMDVKFQIKEAGSTQWKNATEANFPKGGLYVLLPYPEGTNGEDYDFFVAHMITTASNKWDGNPGDIETFDRTNMQKTPEGIVVKLSGLSPVAISYSLNEENDIDNYRFWYHTVYQLMAQKFNIRATAGEGGTITDMGNSEVKYDMSKTYTITPDEGYEIEAVYVNGRNIGPVTSYTFRSIKANQNISATFRKIAWANPFTDVAETDSYYDAIQYVYENGLYNGITLTTFEPETTMNRAMFVTVTGRLEGIREADYPTISFKDVAPGEWYSAYVEWASKNGIVLGYGDGNFGIEDTITVEQTVTILARYAAMKGINTSSSYTLNFADADKVSDWAEASMMWAVENGIYTGKDGMLNPQDEASRALVATMFYRFATTFID